MSWRTWENPRVWRNGPMTTVFDGGGRLPWLGTITAEAGYVYRFGIEPERYCHLCVVEEIYDQRGLRAHQWEAVGDQVVMCSRCGERII